jgi:hypothetical protein
MFKSARGLYAMAISGSGKRAIHEAKHVTSPASPLSLNFFSQAPPRSQKLTQSLSESGAVFSEAAAVEEKIKPVDRTEKALNATIQQFENLTDLPPSEMLEQIKLLNSQLQQIKTDLHKEYVAQMATELHKRENLHLLDPVSLSLKNRIKFLFPDHAKKIIFSLGVFAQTLVDNSGEREIFENYNDDLEIFQNFIALKRCILDKDKNRGLSEKNYWQLIDSHLEKIRKNLAAPRLLTTAAAKEVLNKAKTAFTGLVTALAGALLAAGLSSTGLTILGFALTGSIVGVLGYILYNSYGTGTNAKLGLFTPKATPEQLQAISEHARSFCEDVTQAMQSTRPM